MRCDSREYLRTAAAALIAVGLALVVPGAASAQTRGNHATTAPASTKLGARETVHQSDGKALQVIDLVAGETRTLDAAWPVKKVSVADPQVADVDAISPTRVQIHGKGLGITELALESEQGDVWRARLIVSADTDRLQAQLRQLFPTSALDVAQVDDVVVVKGSFAHAEDAAQLRQLMKLTKTDYLDLTRVAGLQQVQLQVKVAEVSRTAVKMLSSDYAFHDGVASVAVNNGASGTYRPVDPFPTLARALPSGTSIFGTGAVGGAQFEYFIKALEDNQYLRMLAEPTMVARSGQEAQFLVGGEIPIPIANLSGSNTTQISIDWREFGVRLKFTPTVLGDGRIELAVRPEVSELSDVGAIEVNGVRIPSLLTRRVETTLDLQSGQTFAIAGLLDQKDNSDISKLPMLGDLPVLGTLFRSTRYEHQDTEMLVLVTASLVEPSSNNLNPAVPGDLHREPNGWELYIQGHSEGKGGGPKLAPAQRERLERLRLNELIGPGAWASYDEQPHGIAGETGATK